jgi:hypothetical protein
VWTVLETDQFTGSIFRVVLNSCNADVPFRRLYNNLNIPTEELTETLFDDAVITA